MSKKLVVGGAVGLAVAAAAVVAVTTFPAAADPKPSEVVGIGKVGGDYREVRKQIQEGHLVGSPANGPSLPTPTPERTP